jgi:hypothetical protein
MPTSKANSGGPDQHLTNALKDNIVLKKQFAGRPKRRGRQGDAGDTS